LQDRLKDTVSAAAKDANAAAAPAAKDLGDVRRFLNRLLGLPLGRQNLLFNYFASTLAAEIAAARAEGRWAPYNQQGWVAAAVATCTYRVRRVTHRLSAILAGMLQRRTAPREED
jgi:hypothetical protein